MHFLSQQEEGVRSDLFLTNSLGYFVLPKTENQIKIIKKVVRLLRVELKKINK